MAGYLLSTKALYEFVNGVRSPAALFWSWCQGLGTADDLFASELSLGELRTSVEGIPSPKQRDTWRHYLDARIPQQFGARLLPFQGQAVKEWGLIRGLGQDLLPAEETQLVGQAIAGELIYVGQRTAAHVSIGCSMHDPYDGAAWPGDQF